MPIATRKRVGRPTRSPTNKKSTSVLFVRMTKDEKDLMVRRAKAEGARELAPAALKVLLHWARDGRGGT